MGLTEPRCLQEEWLHLYYKLSLLPGSSFQIEMFADNRDVEEKSWNKMDGRKPGKIEAGVFYLNIKYILF